MSVLSTVFAVPKLRRRLAFLLDNKWRLPARDRSTLPVAVTLKRLATAFRVLIPFGRRIFHLSYQKSANYRHPPPSLQVVFWMLPQHFTHPSPGSRPQAHFFTVVFSDHHKMSCNESPAGTFNAKVPPYVAGALIFRPIHRWISACPSAKLNPHAPL